MPNTGPFQIDFDATTTVEQLTRMQVKQWPFARALAATKLAYDARDDLREELPRKFKLTSKWLQSGIRINRATKQQPTATVYSRDEYMADHVTGTIRRPRKRAIAVPTKQVKRTGTGRISKAQRPAALIKKRNVFIGETAAGKPAIMQRVGKGVRILYGLRPEAKIKKRWNFHGTVRKAVEANQVKRLGDALAQAVRTSKK